MSRRRKETNNKKERARNWAQGVAKFNVPKRSDFKLRMKKGSN